MQVGEFKERVLHLALDTPVYVSGYTKEYALQHPEEAAEPYELAPDGALYYRSRSSLKPPVIEDFYQLKDDQYLSIDIEDGYKFAFVAEILFFSDRIILLS